MDSVNNLPPLDGAALLRDVTRRYVRAQRQSVACCGQTTARCHVLGELARGGPLRLSELAARLDADKSWTSRTVAAMTAEGLLSCGDTEGDARGVRIGLTKSGRTRWRRMDAALRRHAEGALAQLSAEEREVVNAGLALLQKVLGDEARGGVSEERPRPARGAERRGGRREE